MIKHSLISFGQNIPIARCSIKDTKKDKYVPATIYEIDCKDKEDIDEIENLDDNFEFKDTFISGMQNKNRTESEGKYSPSCFYKLESEDGEILGVCYAKHENGNFVVKYFASKQKSNYKYVGQSLLAALGINAFHDKQKKLVISSAISSAYDFYKRTCGFKEAELSDLEMDRAGIIKFVRQTEERTKGKIINFGA